MSWDYKNAHKLNKYATAFIIFLFRKCDAAFIIVYFKIFGSIILLLFIYYKISL